MLPEPDYQRVLARAERVSPPLGEVVAQPGASPKWVHFPLSLVLSSTVVLEDGSTVEGSTIGNEGVDGLWLLGEALGNPGPMNGMVHGEMLRLQVQVRGEMLRLPAAAFRQALCGSHALSQLLMRYALVLVQRGAQNAACIGRHTILQRTCRWLLETAERKGRDSFHVTQESLGHLLGVRRQGINVTARFLHRAKLIRYHRGELTILDRARLEEESCECFRATSDLYERSMRLV